MANDAPISGLPAAYSLAGDESLPGVQSGVTKKITIDQITAAAVLAFAFLPPNSSQLIGFVQGGTGATNRTAQSKMRADVSIEDFGGVADGVTDNLAAFYRGMVYLDSIGGGRLRCEGSTYRFSAEIVWGDGSNSQQSTKWHRIVITGRGIGAGAEVSNTEADGATRFVYDGAVDNSKAVLTFAGPLHSVGIEGIVFDANSKAGMGVQVIHCTQSTFRRFMSINHRTAALVLTTRTGFPSGCAYGNSDNVYEQFYSYSPANNTADGIVLTSGVSTSNTLVGSPDSARNKFIGGTVFYGGSTGSTGLRVAGADNNNFDEVLFLPKSGNDGGGNMIYFAQWPASTSFPLENVFINCAGVQGIAGVSGTGGNTFWPLPTSDGIAQPTSDPNLTSINHNGQMVQVRGLFKAGSVGAPSVSFVDEGVSGLYRKALNNISMSISGTDMLEFRTDSLRANAAVDGRGYTGYAGSNLIFGLTRSSGNALISAFDGVKLETGASGGPGSGTVRATFANSGDCTIASTLAVTGAFGCNGKSPATPVVSGADISTAGSTLGSYGFTQAQADSIVTNVNNIKATLKLFGLQS